MLHSATLDGDRDLHSDRNWGEPNDGSLPYMISHLGGEIVVYYDDTKMSRADAVTALMERVEKDLDDKREKLLNQLADLETNLGLVRAKLAKIKGGTV